MIRDKRAETAGQRRTDWGDCSSQTDKRLKAHRPRQMADGRQADVPRQTVTAASSGQTISDCRVKGQTLSDGNPKTNHHVGQFPG